MKRGWLTSLVALSGLMLTMWQWMKKRSGTRLMTRQIMRQWLNQNAYARLFDQMTRMVKRRVRA